MVQTQYSPIQNYLSSSAPDPAEFDIEIERLKIHPKAVVVRAKNGDVVNYYNDNIWNLKHYGGSHTIEFNKFKKDKEIAKRLVYVMLMFGGNQDTGVAGDNLCFLHRTLYHIYEQAQKKRLNLYQALENEGFMYKFILTVPNSKASSTKTNLELIEEIGIYVDIEIPKHQICYEALSDKINIAASRIKTQYPIIPIEIYAEAYNQRWEHFKRIEKNIDNLTLYIKNYATNPYFGRNSLDKRKGRSESKKLILFKKATAKCKLRGLFQHYKITDHDTLVSFIEKVSATCSHLIGASTGMRKDELKMLIQGCFKEADQLRPDTISGWEKKGNKGISREQDWITHHDVGRITVVLEKLGAAMISNITLSEPTKVPLFLRSSAFTNYAMKTKEVVHVIEIENRFTLRGGELRLDESKLILTQDMMDNFLKITHHVGRWDNEEKLKVGEPWHFTYHQYRRSFAFYSINSGLVSFSALQTQLAHGLQATSAYYSQGALNIKPLITDGSNHISREIDAQREEQTAIALTLHMLTNKQHTSDVIDKWARERMIDVNANDPEGLINKAIDRAKVDIKKGYLHAKSTPLGFCTKGDECDSFLTFIFRDCGECNHTERVESKIDRSIGIVKLSITELVEKGYDENSIEMGTQKEELEYFKEQKKKYRS